MLAGILADGSAAIALVSHHPVRPQPRPTLGSFHQGSLDGLAVQDACTGLGIPPHLGSQLFPESSMDGLPGAIQPPETEVMVGGSPRRKFMGEEPPLTSGTKEVEDGVHDLPQGMQSRSAS
jgi:hypothetical protein